jgi:hypothetical protein
MASIVLSAHPGRGGPGTALIVLSSTAGFLWNSLARQHFFQRLLPEGTCDAFQMEFLEKMLSPLLLTVKTEAGQRCQNFLAALSNAKPRIILNC